VSVPPPEFQISKVWPDGLLPCVQEAVTVEDTLSEIVGAGGGVTVKVIGIVCGVFDAPGAVIVIVAA